MNLDSPCFKMMEKFEEKYDINCLVPTVKHDGGGVMMWGVFHGLGWSN